MPADFRLIGATTRNPQEIPEALRSRCTEIFFEPLDRTAGGKNRRKRCGVRAFPMRRGFAAGLRRMQAVAEMR